MKWICIGNEGFEDDSNYRSIHFKPDREHDSGYMLLTVPALPEFNYEVDKSYSFDTADPTIESNDVNKEAMLQELDELAARKKQLAKFLHVPWPTETKFLIELQLQVMTQYELVLSRRIDIFEVPPA